MRLPTAETWAVVVGVGKYPSAPGWALNGPGRDAVRFVNWLLSCGVPPDHIRLCVSAVDDELDFLDAPVPTSGATRDEVLAVFDDQVSKWSGKLLYVFWGGHGTIDEQEDRRLYFANAHPDRPLSLSVPALIKALRNRPGVRIDRQVLLLDVCGLFQADAGFTVDVTPSAPTAGLKQDGTVKQFRFYASRRSEAAIDDNVDRTGMFSQALIQALERRQRPALDPQADWPPDFGVIAREIQDEFEAIAKDDPSTQIPIFEPQDWNEQLLTGSSPAALRQRSFAALRAAFDSLLLPPAPFLSSFRATFPDSPKLSEVQTLGDIFDFLKVTLQPRSKDWPPEAEICERVRRSCQDDARNDLAALDAWLTDVTPRELTALREALDAEDHDVTRHLVVELVPGPAADAPQVWRAWLYRADRKIHEDVWTEQDLADAPSDADRLARVIADVVNRRPRRLVVEFLTPQQHLACSPYSWQLKTKALAEDLGDVYPVVVRWRERLAEPDAFRNGRWRSNLERIVEGVSKNGIASVERLTAPVDHKQLWKRMDQGVAADVLVVDPVSAPLEDTHPLMLALLGGAPAVCAWLRAPANDGAAVSVLETLLKALKPDRIERALYDGRSSADPTTQTICTETVLFWDHPDRNPYRDRLATPRKETP